MKLREIIVPHIYVDMDGVLCDFDKSFVKYDNDISKLANSGSKEIEYFFANLRYLPDGSELVDYLKSNNLKFTILSSPLRPPERNSSIRGKKTWLKRYLPSHYHNSIFDSEKYAHCTKGDILIDDMSKNIDPWIKCGGIGILHTNIDDTIDQLKRALG
jgi:5'(3')-deoxyribonucleotidase